LEYERLCQKYPGHSKAIRSRLIAADSGGPVPQLAKDVFASLLKKTKLQTGEREETK
jgi:hypothetical protein